jgi:hypothetical protein
MDWFLMPWSVCVKSNPHPSIFVDDVAPLRQGKEEGTGNLLPLGMLKYLAKNEDFSFLTYSFSLKCQMGFSSSVLANSTGKHQITLCNRGRCLVQVIDTRNYDAALRWLLQRESASTRCKGHPSSAFRSYNACIIFVRASERQGGQRILSFGQRPGVGTSSPE